MSSRKLLVLVLLSLLIVSSVNGEGLVPPLQLPEMPQAQEGDDQTAEVTIGEMRNALYYQKAYPILLEYIEELKAKLVVQAMQTDQERVKRLEVEMKLDAVKGQRNMSLVVNAAQLAWLLLGN